MMRLQWCLMFASLLVVTGCTSATQPSQVIASLPTAASQARAIGATNPTVAVSPTLPAQQQTSSASTASTCPVTIPNRNTPPREQPSPNHHGNGALWTVLWPEGIVRATPDYVQSDGSVNMKFPWWRGVTGKLTITGRRLDTSAPPLQASVPDGYGDIGFQASGITFPTEGCWEVTGRAGGAELTFVTFVVKEQQPG